MSTVISISARRRYDVAWVCPRIWRVWGVARSGVYRRRRTAEAPAAPRRRRGPQGPMPDTALVETIRRTLASSPFHGEGHRKVWARVIAGHGAAASLFQRHAGLGASSGALPGRPGLVATPALDVRPS